MRRGLLAIGLLIVSAQASRIDQDFAHKILTHEKYYDLFVRNYFGCQFDVPVTTETCKLSTGFVDYTNFRKACEAAKELYRLTGSCT